MSGVGIPSCASEEKGGGRGSSCRCEQQNCCAVVLGRLVIAVALCFALCRFICVILVLLGSCCSHLLLACVLLLGRGRVWAVLAALESDVGVCLVFASIIQPHCLLPYRFFGVVFVVPYICGIKLYLFSGLSASG